MEQVAVVRDNTLCLKSRPLMSSGNDENQAVENDPASRMNPNESSDVSSSSGDEDSSDDLGSAPVLNTSATNALGAKKSIGSMSVEDEDTDGEDDVDNEQKGPRPNGLVIRFKHPSKLTSTVSPVSSVNSADSLPAKLQHNNTAPKGKKKSTKARSASSKKSKSRTSSSSSSKSPSRRGKKPGIKKPTKGSYLFMIQCALLGLKEKNGSSLVAIRKFCEENFNVSGKSNFKGQLSMAMKRAVAKEEIVRTGARYKLSKRAKNGLKAKENSSSGSKAEESSMDPEEIKSRKRSQEKERKEKEIELYRKMLPAPPTPSNELFMPQSVFGDVSSICEFLICFGKPLRLAPFTLQMFYNALAHDTITYLIRDVHFSMLDLILEETEDVELNRLRWEGVLNVLTWQEILRQYIVRGISTLDDDYPDMSHLSTAVSKLSNSSYPSLTLRSKIAILRLLCDDLLSCKSVIAVLDRNLEQRIELGKSKWKVEQEVRTKMKELKEQKLGLVEGEMGQRKLQASLNANEKSMALLTQKRSTQSREHRRKKREFYLRCDAIGRDGLGNELWCFKSDRLRVYLHGCGLRGEKKTKERWRCLESKAQIDQLMSSLDKFNLKDRQFLNRLETFYDLIIKKLPKDTKAPSPTPEAKTKEEDDDAESEVEQQQQESLLKMIRPQRSSARRAQEAIRETSTSAPRIENCDLDRKRRLQREQSRPKQEEDSSCFLTYKNFESPYEDEELLTMRTHMAPAFRSIANGEKPEFVMDWIVAELKGLTQTVSDNGARFDDLRGLLSEISEIPRACEPWTSAKVSRKARSMIDRILIQIESAAVEIINQEKTKTNKRKRKSESDDAALELESDYKILKKTVDKYREGSYVLCEILRQDNHTKSKDKTGSISPNQLSSPTEDAKSTGFISGAENSSEQKKPVEKTEADSKEPVKKSQRVEIVRGTVEHFRCANFGTVGFGCSDGWEINLDNGEFLNLNEEQLQDALQFYRMSDNQEYQKNKREPREGWWEYDFPSVALWKLRSFRESWVLNLSSAHTVSNIALALFTLSRQILIVHEAAFPKRREGVIIDTE